MTNSRAKGKRGELELAKRLREYGFDTRRGQQYSGANGDADVVGLPGIHIECKRVEHLNLYKAMDQSERDARLNEVAVVMHRKNDCDWLVTMHYATWLSFCLNHSPLPEYYIEYKFTERLNLYDAMSRCRRNAQGVIPGIVHEKKYHHKLLTMYLEDWIEFYKEWGLL